MNTPRVLIAGLRGGSGKTLCSTGCAAALVRRGLSVQPYKKGPDYIDAAWLGRAALRPCYNLDTFMIGEDRITRSFASRVSGADIALIEGNRGLFDGMDIDGSHSTARLAAAINAPVVLTVDCTKSTRTVAAFVKGCIDFDPGVNIAGIILNRVAGIRHQKVVTSSIEKYCGVPVLGALPKLKFLPFPERHMGLVPPDEHDLLEDAIKQTAKAVEHCIDLEALVDIARSAGTLDAFIPQHEFRESSGAAAPVIGVVRDSAFQFYYPENIEELAACGARIIDTSPLAEERLPEVDALYIGGGFPETHARRLAENSGYMNSLKEAIEGGLPVYAECGGAMFLGKQIVVDGVEYPMTGIFGATFGMDAKPQRHGYTILETRSSNPFFKAGTVFRGHEFHYSKIVGWDGEEPPMAFNVKRGYGMNGRSDGLMYANTVALYTHVHALGVEGWAESFADSARAHAGGKIGGTSKHAAKSS